MFFSEFPVCIIRSTEIDWASLSEAFKVESTRLRIEKSRVGSGHFRGANRKESLMMMCLERVGFRRENR